MIDMQTYTQWKGKVNFLLVRSFGLGVDDLPDCPYRDWYEDDVSPATAAKRAIAAAEFGDYDAYDD